jgi:zinc/manganese transport system substrate-binding protein/manganese/iron transport system substrate-binding protein
MHRIDHRIVRRVGLLICAALITGSLSGCGAEKTSDFRIVTTTTQVTDITRQVVGGTGSVFALLQANQSAHAFDPSARDLLELSVADALIVNGEGLEPWLDDALSASGFSGTLIVASRDVTPQSRDGVIDPHVWTDPANAQKMTNHIAIELARIKPSQGSALARNAEAYDHQLQALDVWIRATFAQVPSERRLLVTNHDAFTYFVTAYDISLVGSIIPEFDDNAEPSAADIDALIAKIRRTGVRAIFAESSISPKLAQTVANEAGIRVFAGEDSLYSDTLGPQGSGAESYISATIHNGSLLALAWGVRPLPLPQELTHD